MSYSARAAGGSPQSKRSGIFALLAIAVIVLLVLLRWFQMRGVATPSQAKLEVLSGVAAIQGSEAGAEKVTIEAPGMSALQRGDVISLAADSSARLTLPGGDTLELQAGSLVTMMDFSGGSMSRAAEVWLALDEGSALVQGQVALLQGTKLQIDTPVASVVSQGAVFSCKIVDSNHTYVAVQEGQVEVSMGSESAQLQAGQGVDAQLGQSLVPVGVPLASPGATQAARPASVSTSATATLTDNEKTLFPPVVTPTKPGDNYQLYTVQKGDTLYSISRQFGVSWEEIYSANRDVLSSPETIRAGQQLHIPKP